MIMAIFNEAYITEFFGFGKNKKKENKKKNGLITKEEYQKCKSIITSIYSKFKIIYSFSLFIYTFCIFLK